MGNKIIKILLKTTSKQVEKILPDATLAVTENLFISLPSFLILSFHLSAEFSSLFNTENN